MCPKCKVKLKIADGKISPQGTRFKCPKCSAVLLVKRPAPSQKKLDDGTVLVAHENQSVRERLASILSTNGYKVLTSADGIEAMITATQKLPFLAVVGVSLPKIYGFEVAKKLKGRADTGNIKIILVSSVYDARRYRREPESLYNADDYIEEHLIEGQIIDKINALKEGLRKKPTPPREEVRTPAVEAPPRQQPPVETPAAQIKDAEARARRLARTILADIYLYSKSKVEESILGDTFRKTFSAELKEGLKLYENRVPADVRNQGDFFNDEISIFIEKRKRAIS